MSIRPSSDRFLASRVPACLLGCALLLQATAGTAREDFTLSLSGDLISIDAEDVDLRLVLQELSLQSGIRIWISDNLPAQPITMHFNDKPMSVTLRRLLKDSNYAAVYGDNNAITGLYILAPGSQQSEFLDAAAGDSDDGQQASPVSLPSAATTDSSELNEYQTQLLQEQLQVLDQYGNATGTLYDQAGENSGAEAQAATLSEALGEIDQSLSDSGLVSPEAMQQLREQIESGGNLQPSE